MKSHPYIFAKPYGYRVLIERPGLTYSAFVRYRTVNCKGQRPPPPITAAEQSAALTKAIALRDQFLAAHGTYSRSNTGHRGISETVKWSGGRPYPSFQCNYHRTHRARFYFSTLTERDQALRQAISWRKTLDAETVSPSPRRESASDGEMAGVRCLNTQTS